ncbi:beta-microsemino -like protein [Labeo rohita]|uniref:Beta-microsemino-like protein n=1 Tax=Labeo rohita TaxID=84645 RepID=A0A498P263_LABRO|nr:beta-microsemino -like protein [Labeo rohita]
MSAECYIRKPKVDWSSINNVTGHLQGCVDSDGVTHDFNSEWDKDCYNCHCTLFGIKCCNNYDSYEELHGHSQNGGNDRYDSYEELHGHSQNGGNDRSGDYGEHGIPENDKFETTTTTTPPTTTPTTTAEIQPNGDTNSQPNNAALDTEPVK